MDTTANHTHPEHDRFMAVLEADVLGVLEDQTRDRIERLGRRVREQLAAPAGAGDRQLLADTAEELAWLLDAVDVANHHHHGLGEDRCALCAGKQDIESERAEFEARMWADCAAADDFADAAERGLGL